MSDDTALVVQLASALQNTPHRVILCRSSGELLMPLVVDRIDLLLLDERLAQIDTWNIAKRVKHQAGADRTIAICGLLQRIDPELMMKSREFGLDALLLKSNIGPTFMKRINPMISRIAAREADPEWSPFLTHKEFLVVLGEQIKAAQSAQSSKRSASPHAETITFETDAAGRKTAKDPAPGTGLGPLQPVSRTTPRKASERKDESGSDLLTVPDLIGHTLGKLLIQEEIGRGAGGVVFLGRHTSLDIPVAVKVLYPELVQRDPDFANRFLIEARMAAGIRNGNVVRVLDCDRDPETGCFYIAMEHISGNSLEDQIAKVGKLSEMAVCEIAIEVSTCLRAAEAQGVVHRDIKPANILLTEDREVKVADLGLATNVGAAQGIKTGRLTEKSASHRNTNIVGTPYYIAPEQINTDATVDSRADIYSLGVTLYHAATGVVPFEANNLGDLFYMHINCTAPSVLEKRSDYSAEFDAILARMMAKAPDDRFSSCREMLSALKAHRDWMIEKRSTAEEGIVKRLCRSTMRLKAGA